jgi:hypothetical protein
MKKVTIQESAAKKVPSSTVNSHVYAAFRVLTLNAEERANGVRLAGLSQPSKTEERSIDALVQGSMEQLKPQCG